VRRAGSARGGAGDAQGRAAAPLSLPSSGWPESPASRPRGHTPFLSPGASNDPRVPNQGRHREGNRKWVLRVDSGKASSRGDILAETCRNEVEPSQ
jgi:hypothetical protein